MTRSKIVVDTNVVVAGLQSSKGASFLLLSEIGRGDFDIALSVPLVLEYEDALKRRLPELGLRSEDIDDVLDYLCSVAELKEIFFLWRPLLKDPKDDLILELAVAAACEAIVTFNKRDFREADTFDARILDPAEFLKKVGVLS